MKRNRLRELLDANAPTLGTSIYSPWTGAVEVVGHTGLFDYVEFLGEHVAYDLKDLDSICMAAELYGMGTMIKVDQEPRRFLSQRAVGSGFDAVLFADSRSAKDAFDCVSAVRPDTPTSQGTYGSANRRNSYWAKAGSADYVEALERIVVVLMVEKAGMVRDLDAVLAVGGVDMVQFGGGDYSMNIGRPGESRSSEVRAVERDVIRKCLLAGVRPRAEINSLDEASYYLDLGVKDFALGTDLGVLFEWLSRNGRGLRESLRGRQTST